MVSMKTKAESVAEISRVLRVLSEKFDSTEGDAERDFMAQRCPKHLRKAVRELPTLALHLLDDIAEGSVSVVGLAARSGQLKGTVSKHVQRLVTVGLVQRSPVPGNRKQIALSLTNDGRTVARAHRQMHDEIDRQREQFFLRYSGAELSTVVKILTDLSKTERVSVRLQPEPLL